MAQTTVPLNTTSDQPTRRGLLAGIAAAGMVGSVVAATAVTADGVDPHLQWEDEAREFHRLWIAAIDIDGTAEIENMVAWDDRCWRIVSTAPNTPSGLAAQLRAIFWGQDQLHPNDYLDCTAEHRARVVERVVAMLDGIAAGRAVG